MTDVELQSLPPSERKCSICHQPMHPNTKDSGEVDPPINPQVENPDTPFRLACTHVFGKSCLIRWLRYSQTCPICRHPTPRIASAGYLWAEERAYRVDPVEALHLNPAAAIPRPIVGRALDFFEREISVREVPVFHLRWVLQTMCRWLQIYHAFMPSEDQGWKGYMKLLRECCQGECYTEEWIDRFQRRKADADEAERALGVVRAELESCGDMLGWEALPGCCQSDEVYDVRLHGGIGA